MIKKINGKRFGEILREIRMVQGFTQAELAEHACISSETIRRIEKQYDIPKMHVIDSLSKVLKTDLLLLFLELKSVNPMSKFYNQLDELIIEYDVDTLSQIYSDFLEIKNLRSCHNVLELRDIEQFEYAIKGLELSYKSKQKGSSEALDLYISALKLTLEFDLENFSVNSYSFFELKCLLLISLELNALSQFEQSNKISLYLEKLITNYNNMSSLDNTMKLQIKVLQNISYNYHCLSDDEKALCYAEKGIDFCTSNHSMYLLFALYYRKATALYFLEDDKNYAIECFKRSITVLDLLGKQNIKRDYINITKNKYNIDLLY